MKYKVENGELRLPVEEFNRLNESWEILERKTKEVDEMRVHLMDEARDVRIEVIDVGVGGWTSSIYKTYYTKDSNAEIERRVKERVEEETQKLKEEYKNKEVQFMKFIRDTPIKEIRKAKKWQGLDDPTSNIFRLIRKHQKEKNL